MSRVVNVHNSADHRNEINKIKVSVLNNPNPPMWKGNNMKEHTDVHPAITNTCENLVSVSAYIPSHELRMREFFDKWLPKFKWEKAGYSIIRNPTLIGTFSDGPKNTFKVLLHLDDLVTPFINTSITCTIYGIKFDKAFTRKMLSKNIDANIKITGLINDCPEVLEMASELLSYTVVVDKTSPEQIALHHVEPSRIQFSRPRINRDAGQSEDVADSVESRHTRVVLIDKDYVVQEHDNVSDETGVRGWEYIKPGQYLLTEVFTVFKYKPAVTNIRCECYADGVSPRFHKLDTGAILTRLSDKDCWGLYKKFLENNEITTLFDY